MKYLSILLLSLFVSSCCGKKRAIETQPEPVQELSNIALTEPANDDREIHEMIEVVGNDGKSIVELSSSEEAKEYAKKHNDSINKDLSFHQDVSKRILTEHQLWNELLKKHISKSGNVDYNSLKKDHDKLLGYIRLLQITYEKINFKTERSKEEKLAFWINAYNALTIDLILRNYPTKSIKDIKEPWNQRLWKFGDKWQNLNDIEHKILRKMDEPRIHFAIVCASVSCPKLQNEAFTAEKLEEQLTNATKEFLSDTSKNEFSKDKIRLSKIFKWFKKDFEQDGNLIDFLNQYSEVSISSNAKKSFKDYNWDLNE